MRGEDSKEVENEISSEAEKDEMWEMRWRTR